MSQSCTKQLDVSKINSNLTSKITGTAGTYYFGSEIDYSPNGNMLMLGAISSANYTHDSKSGGEVQVINNIGIGNPTLDIANLDGTNGHTLYNFVDTAPLDQDGFGFNVFFQDINCDGIDDLVLSDPWIDTIDSTGVNNGQLYIVYGPLTFVAKDISTLDASTGLVFKGQQNGENLSWNSSPIYNFSNAKVDQCQDIGFTAHKADSDGLTDNGHVQVLQGDKDIGNKFTGKSDYTSVDFVVPNKGMQIAGLESGDQLIFISSARDVNNDGFADIVTSSFNRDISYVIFGSKLMKSQTTFDLGKLDGSNGFKIQTGYTDLSNQHLRYHESAYIDDDVQGDVIIPNNHQINIIFGAEIFPAELIFNLATEGKVTTITFDSGEILEKIHNVGDVNGDQVEDIIAAFADKAQLIQGGQYLKKSKSFDINQLLDNCYAVEIVNGTHAPMPSSRTADFDDDGRNDIIMGQAGIAEVIIFSSSVIAPGVLTCHRDQANWWGKCLTRNTVNIQILLISFGLIAFLIIVGYLLYYKFCRTFIYNGMKTNTKDVKQNIGNV